MFLKETAKSGGMKNAGKTGNRYNRGAHYSRRLCTVHITHSTIQLSANLRIHSIDFFNSTLVTIIDRRMRFLLSDGKGEVVFRNMV